MHIDTRPYSNSSCKQPNNCKGNCQCGADTGNVVKVIDFCYAVTC